MGSNRCRFDIIAAILNTAVNNWATKTEILYRANLSFGQLTKYMKFLVDRDLLTISQADKGKRYRTTKLGIEFLQDYEKITKVLSGP